MRRIGPCKILEKYEPKVYKMDLPKDMAISPIFNVKDLLPYKGLMVDKGKYQEELKKDVIDLQVPEREPPQVKKILDSKVKKSTRNKVYKEHLVKWKDKLEAEAIWVAESDFKKVGNNKELINPKVP